MIEPTETEDKQTLEDFAEAMINIDEKIDSDSSYLLTSPYKTPVRRLNEAQANRELDINYNDIQKKD